VLSDVEFEWDEKKNIKLKKERRISFQQIVEAINSGRVIEVRDHPNQRDYPNQKLIIVRINDYVWVVPCEWRRNKLRLITAYPSRKYTKQFLVE
jgi:uncharacterized DUF497 family protein